MTENVENDNVVFGLRKDTLKCQETYPNAMRTTEMRTTEKQKTATENRQASLICTVGALCKRANVDIDNVH